MIVSTHGSTSSAVGTVRVSGVYQAGMSNTNPASPIISGRAPRLLASTGMPLTIASAGTRPNDSFHSEGIRSIFVST